MECHFPSHHTKTTGNLQSAREVRRIPSLSLFPLRFHTFLSPSRSLSLSSLKKQPDQPARSGGLIFHYFPSTERHTCCFNPHRALEERKKNTHQKKTCSAAGSFLSVRKLIQVIVCLRARPPVCLARLSAGISECLSARSACLPAFLPVWLSV